MASKSSSGNGSFIGFVFLLFVIGALLSFFREYWPFIVGAGGALLFVFILLRINKSRAAAKYRQEQELLQKTEQERKRREAAERERAAAAARAAAQNESPAAPASEIPAEIEVPEEINGAACAYQYEKVYFDLLPKINPETYLGRKVRFDDVNGDIFVKVGSKRIGTMRSNRLADMVSDWLERNDPIFAVVTHTNDDPLECAFDLYLYRKEKWDDEE